MKSLHREEYLLINKSLRSDSLFEILSKVLLKLEKWLICLLKKKQKF